MPRLDELKRFYDAMALLEKSCGGKRLLADCDGRMGWPEKGVYFFFEEGEKRTDSGDGMRVVRVGTHAISSTSKTTLWKRLYQHKGAKNGVGNHRGSIFRLLVGEALQRVSGGVGICQTWGQGQSAPSSVRQDEQPHECTVSQHIGSRMLFLWLSVQDLNQRKEIEKYCIRLLSNDANNPHLDQPSDNWLGSLSPRPLIISSGLWNQDYADQSWAPPQNGQPTPVDLILQLAGQEARH